MIRVAVATALAVGFAGPASAASGTTTSTDGSAVARLLQQNYEIKAAFADNTGGAYMVLEKGQSAYLCHSSPNQTCEKLN